MRWLVLSEVSAVVLSEVCGRTFRRRRRRCGRTFRRRRCVVGGFGGGVVVSAAVWLEVAAVAVWSEVSAAVLSWECGAYVL